MSAANGKFDFPSSGYEIAYNAYIDLGSPGAGGAINSSSWQDGFNNWIGPILAAKGAYQTHPNNPLDAVTPAWLNDPVAVQAATQSTAAVTGTPVAQAGTITAAPVASASPTPTAAATTVAVNSTPIANAPVEFPNPANGYEITYNRFLSLGSPGSSNAAKNTPAWQQAFNSWIEPILDKRGAYRTNPKDPMSAVSATWWDDKGFGATNQVSGLITAKGGDGPVMGPATPPEIAAANANIGGPVEKGFYDYTMDNYVYPDLEADKQRRALAGDVLNQYQPALDAQRSLINDTLVTDANGNSGLLNRELAASNTASQEQLAALNAQITSMTGNLDGELAAKGQALREQVAAYAAGLSKYTAAERAALATRLQENFASLAGEVSSKKDNLQAQLASMGTAVTELDAAKQASLQSQIAGLNSALGTETAGLRSALQTETGSLRTALDEETAGLKAAQIPLNETRVKGAETLASSINLGVERAEDGVTAQFARNGYLGGDTGTSNALMRATLEGRANAANAVADARNLNATDDRGIAARAATEGRSLSTRAANDERGISNRFANDTRTIANQAATDGRAIADSTATNRFDLAKFGADGTRTLGDYDAASRKAIADLGAESGQAIGSLDAQNQLKLDQLSADSTRSLSDYGATQRRGIGDLGATDTRGINDSAAQRKMSYFNADITRRLAALSLPQAAVQAEFDIRNSADNYSQSGLGRAQNNMSFFNIGTSQAPNTQTYTGAATNMNNQGSTAQAYTGNTNNGAGSALGNFGAGMIGLAGSIGNANNWWSKPTVATPGASTAPAALAVDKAIKNDENYSNMFNG